MTDWRGQWAEVLPLTLTTQNDHHAPLGTQAFQGSHRSADIGALAVIKIFNIIDDGHRLYTVRLTHVVAQGIKYRAERTPCAAGQRQGGQRIHRIVPPPDTQGVCGHQALNVNFLFLGHTSALFDSAGFVGLMRTHQPCHAVDHLDAKIARALRHVRAKRQHAVCGLEFLFDFFCAGRHGHDGQVFAVQDHEGLPTKYR